MTIMLALILVIGFVLGCGNDGSTSTPGSTAASKLYPSVVGPARSFLVPAGDNAVPTFGREATASEREQASRVIEAWMRARAKADWKKDCSYFSRAFIHSLVATDAHQVSGGKVDNCPQALAYFGSQASGDLVNTLTGPIDSLRIEGKQGYALYHGRRGVDWTVPMSKEKKRWKVSTASPIERAPE